MNIYKVKGYSMFPDFCPGDYVVTSQWFFLPYKIGDVLVLKHPVYQTIIKRLIDVNKEGELLLAGANPDSVASQSLGWQLEENVLGKVIWHIADTSNSSGEREGQPVRY